MVIHFGELLKTWRKQKKLSYKDLSMLSGVSGATLARWESGRTQPRMAEMDAVLNSLQVPAAQREQALALLETPRAVQRLRETAGAGPPVSGDLLRAMRLRRGWTQQETAQRAGIAQGTLARWERSLDWPSAERLHTLCYVLEAHEDELLALLRGQFVSTAPLETAPDPDEVRAQVTQAMFYSPLADLEFLGLEAQLWQVSRRHEGAQLQLSHAVGFHARYLAIHQRFEEAAHYVERTQQLASSGYRDDLGWSAAVMAASRVAASGGQPLHLKRAINILHNWVDRAPIAENRGYQAWIISEVALYMLRMGHGETALLQSKRAIRIGSSTEGVEGWWRRGDHAKILLQTGRYDEALDECSDCLSHVHPIQEGVHFRLTGVEALLALSRFAEAADWLRRIYEIIDEYPAASHHRAAADALRQRL
jgi:transcriptional regulator with XRE-family HTH domain